jgi:hypothetical protein
VPKDGTRLQGLPSGDYWSISDGSRFPTPAAGSAAIALNDASLYALPLLAPSLSSNHTNIEQGQAVTLSGHTWPGASVQLYRHVSNGAPGYREVLDAVIASSSGKFKFAPRPSRNGYFKVSVDEVVESASLHVTVDVAPFTLHATSPNKNTVRMAANALGEQKRAIVKFYRVKADGGRVYYGKDTADRNGNAHLKHEYKSSSGKRFTFVAKIIPVTANSNTFSPRNMATIK